MAREGRRKEQWLRTRWALASCLLHGGLIAVAAFRLQAPVHVTRPIADPLELAIDAIEFEAQSTLERAPELAAAPSQAQRAAGAQGSSSRVGRAIAPSAATNEAAVAEEPPEVSSDAGQLESPVLDAPLGPRRSLVELGVEGPSPASDRKGDAQASKAARAQRRLNRSLEQALASDATSVMLGPGGPVMRSLEQWTYASTVALNGSALFTVTIDASGKLLSLTADGAGSDAKKWQQIAALARAALADQRLNVAKGRAMKLRLEVTSHLELPSGRDPGLEIRAFGLPLKRGGGKRSTRIELLSPTALLGLDGDPADIGAPARRMVHARVLSQELM